MDDGVRLTLEAGGPAGAERQDRGGHRRQAVVTAGGWTAKLLAGAAATGPCGFPGSRSPRNSRRTSPSRTTAPCGRASTTCPGTGPDYTGLVFAGLRHADAGRGDQGRLARRGPGGGPGPAVLPAGARPARGPAGLRPDLAARASTPTPSSAISCTYTTTLDENFVLDRIGPVVIGAGFSGHGFKFTPVVGRILADLATGDPARAADLLRHPLASSPQLRSRATEPAGHGPAAMAPAPPACAGPAAGRSG